MPSVPGALPGLNDLVRVSLSQFEEPGDDGSGRDVPTRIQDFRADPKTGRILDYLIAVPRFSGNVELPAVNSECWLQWPTAQGICTLPTTFQAQETIGNGLRVWRLRVTGPASRDQRRRYFRVDSAVPTTLQIRHDLDALDPERLELLERNGIPAALARLPHSLDAVSLNISEGGLRCLTSGRVLPADLPLITRFTFDTVCFVIEAHVVWSAARDYDDRPAVESALAFDDPGENGDVLRPLLFQVQLAARRAGRE